MSAMIAGDRPGSCVIFHLLRRRLRSALRGGQGCRRGGKLLPRLPQFRLHLRKLLPGGLQAPFDLGDLLVPGGEIVGRLSELALELRLTALEVLGFPREVVAVACQSRDVLFNLAPFLVQPLRPEKESKPPEQS